MRLASSPGLGFQCCTGSRHPAGREKTGSGSQKCCLRSSVGTSGCRPTGHPTRLPRPQHWPAASWPPPNSLPAINATSSPATSQRTSCYSRQAQGGPFCDNKWPQPGQSQPQRVPPRHRHLLPGAGNRLPPAEASQAPILGPSGPHTGRISVPTGPRRRRPLMRWELWVRPFPGPPAHPLHFKKAQLGPPHPSVGALSGNSTQLVWVHGGGGQGGNYSSHAQLSCTACRDPPPSQ